LKKKWKQNRAKQETRSTKLDSPMEILNAVSFGTNA